MNETISKIKALLIEASERQHEVGDKIEIVDDILARTKTEMLHWKKQKEFITLAMNAPRTEAKLMAEKYVLDGMDSSLLPRAMTVRYRKSYDYDDNRMLMWLIDNGYEDVLKIDTKKLKAVLDNRGTFDCPATEVESAEIACDTDLKWMTEDD